MTSKLNVIWATPNGCEKDWEVDYIKELLDGMGIPYELESLTRMDRVVANALIVINHGIPYMKYLQQYEQRNVPFGVIHLSDEWFDDDVSFYNFNMCKFVFRNYYHEHFETVPGGEKVKFLPLSYKHGFWKDYSKTDSKSPKDITFNQRDYMWSFAGAKRSDRTDREATLDIFSQLVPFKTHYESGNSFSSPVDGLSTADYLEMMLNTKFGLCPRGISKTLAGDTGRVTESLEAGCIPVVLKGQNSKGDTYWKSLYGKDAPYVQGNDWQDCFNQVQELLTNPDACEAKRVECFEFWQQVKKGVSATLASCLRTHLYPAPNPAAGLDWSRFKGLFISRHSMHEDKIHELYRMNLRILNYIPWPKIAVQDPPALDYMIHCVEGYKNEYDWIINLDDDAFLCDFRALYDLMVHMEENQYDICGMPDGLTYTPRDVFNPVSMNPFFNVIQLKTIKTKLKSPQDMIANYHPSLLQYVDVAKYHPEMWGKKAHELNGSEFPVGYEPYYPFFYGIAPKVKILWLYGRSYTFDPNAPRESVIIPDEPRRAQTWPFGKKGITFDDDPWTTVLYNHENKEVCLHTWYARNYGGNFDPTLPIVENVKRIDRIFKMSCEKLGLI